MLDDRRRLDRVARRGRVRILDDVRVLDATDAEARDALVPERGGGILGREDLRLGGRPRRVHRGVRGLLGRRVGRDGRRRGSRRRRQAAGAEPVPS